MVLSCGALGNRKGFGCYYEWHGEGSSHWYHFTRLTPPTLLRVNSGSG